MLTIIREIREAAGYTQTEIAYKANLTPRGYKYIEDGERTPNVIAAQRIAQALGKRVEELFPPEPT